MTRNMSSLDRGVRALVIAPAAVDLGFLVGSGSIAGCRTDPHETKE